MKILKIIKKKVEIPEENLPDQKMDPLSIARAEKQRRKALGEVIERKNPREVWLLDKSSMRKAVNCNCYDCVGGENHVKRIRFCNIQNCPFWGMRPYKKGITLKMCQEWVEDSQQVKDDE